MSNLIDRWLEGLFAHFFDFKGRMTRREFWLFIFGNALAGALLVGFSAVMSALMASSSKVYIFGFVLLLLPYLYMLIAICPVLGAFVRRLHDVNKSGWYLCFIFIPIVGQILMLIALCSAGTPGENRFGPGTGRAANYSAPKTPTAPAAPAAPAAPVYNAPQAPKAPVYNAPQVPAAPAAPAPEAKQLVVTCTAGPIMGCTVCANSVTIGRDHTRCNMLLPADTVSVSREHCAVALAGGRITLTDLGSRNGTRLRNGIILEAYNPVELRSGDEFAISREVHFRVELR